MIIYKCIYSGSEMFGDDLGGNIQFLENGLVKIKCCPKKKETTEVSDAMFGGNKSAEAEPGDDDGVDETPSETVLDIVEKYRLLQQPDVTNKTTLKMVLTDYVKQVRGKFKTLIENECKETAEGYKEQLAKFQKSLVEAQPWILKHYKDFLIYDGDQEGQTFCFVFYEKPEGAEDGPEVPYYYCFRHALIEEKF